MTNKVIQGLVTTTVVICTKLALQCASEQPMLDRQHNEPYQKLNTSRIFEVIFLLSFLFVMATLLILYFKRDYILKFSEQEKDRTIYLAKMFALHSTIDAIILLFLPLATFVAIKYGLTATFKTTWDTQNGKLVYTAATVHFRSARIYISCVLTTVALTFNIYQLVTTDNHPLAFD